MTSVRFGAAALGRAYDVAAVREQQRGADLRGQADRGTWCCLTRRATVVTRG